MERIEQTYRIEWHDPEGEFDYFIVRIPTRDPLIAYQKALSKLKEDFESCFSLEFFSPNLIYRVIDEHTGEIYDPMRLARSNSMPVGINFYTMAGDDSRAAYFPKCL